MESLRITCVVLAICINFLHCIDHSNANTNKTKQGQEKKIHSNKAEQSQKPKVPEQEFLKQLKDALSKNKSLEGIAIHKIEVVHDQNTVYLDPVGEFTKESQRDDFARLAGILAVELSKKTGIDLRVRQIRMNVAHPSLEELKLKLLSLIKSNSEMDGVQILNIHYSKENDKTVAIYDAILAFDFQQTIITDQLNNIFTDTFGKGQGIPQRPDAMAGKIILKTPSASEIISELMSLIDQDLTLDGVLVCDGSYIKRPEGYALLLNGRVAFDDQLEIIVGMTNKLIDDKYGSQWPRAVSTGLEVVHPRSEQGQKYFLLGKQLYYEKCYEKAIEAFRYAIVESPDSLAYRYWLILSMIDLGKTESAYAYMKRLVISRKWGFDPSATNDYVDVLYSLQRVQNRSRRILHCYERKAQMECETLIPR